MHTHPSISDSFALEGNAPSPVLRWHAVVFLTLAYLQQRAHEQPTLADTIETHRHEHIVEWLKAVAECAIQSGSVGKVLRRFAGASPQTATT